MVDLGSGGGLDCFLAAAKVGPSGQVIGVDMTEEVTKIEFFLFSLWMASLAGIVP